MNILNEEGNAADFALWLACWADHSTKSAFEQNVACMLLDSCDPKSTIEDVIEHGCISGIISELIYYVDTHEFYNKHYEEIEKLRRSYYEDTGVPVYLPFDEDLKNWLAWWSFEYIAYAILCEWEEAEAWE